MQNIKIIIGTENVLMVAGWRGVRGMGDKGEGINKNKLVVTEKPGSCKVQHREQSSQRTYMQDPWTWTTVWGLPEENYVS